MVRDLVQRFGRAAFLGGVTGRGGRGRGQEQPALPRSAGRGRCPGDMMIDCCDVRSHVVSESVKRRLADARDVIRAVSRPVPALTCVAGSCSAGCGAQGKARGSRSVRGHRRGEGWRGVNDSEPLLMPRNHHILGRVAVQGDRGWPLRCGRRRPGTITGRVDTAAPGVQRAPRSSRVSRARNTETPSGSAQLVVAR